ncbi:hypothetical protein CSQ96_11150 [Janthinobacterium sp. BJB412]|nr:hypothetical protein CSQ96_11150 [Janthinobacterium sp. BJB412]
MQIIVPMSGFGERFRRAGHRLPKPLIEVDGKPIIAHVVGMFDADCDFVFVCNQEHLAEPAYRMAETLRRWCPQGRVVAIAPHGLGPVHAVLQALRQEPQLINPARPVLVNYCDFCCYWDWRHFQQFVASSECDGAIPAYRGFHPHTLGSTNYAYLRETDGWVEAIQEKQPYTDNRMEEYASSGSYYFASGRLMEEALRGAVEQQLTVGGEYYVSLAYRPLLQAGRRIAVYPLQHFMQWGTPQDLAEYQGWSAAFARLARPAAAPAPAPAPGGALLLPMAGMGQRFADQGYALTKPLIEVSGRPMVEQAVRDLPPAARHCFVLRADMPGHDEIAAELRHGHPAARIVSVAALTEGQACTALLGAEALLRAPADGAGTGGSAGGDDDDEAGDQDSTDDAAGSASTDSAGPLTVGACDFGMLYDAAALQALLDDPAVDLIVWGVRGNANAIRRPQMFGWIDAERGRIRRVSVKAPLAAPASDPIVLGAFTFRRADDLRRLVELLLARDGRVNGEFYLDSCVNDAIALGLDCRLFEVDHYLSWGTPDDLRTFEYWQSCFHKWHGHAYTLEADGRVPPDKVEQLALRYRATVPAGPGRHQPAPGRTPTPLTEPT